MRPLTGRELGEQHKALMESGIDRDCPGFTLRWLRRQVDLMERARAERNAADERNEP